MFDLFHLLAYLAFYIAGGITMIVAMVHWSIHNDIVVSHQIPAHPFTPHTMNVREDVQHIEEALAQSTY